MTGNHPNDCCSAFSGSSAQNGCRPQKSSAIRYRWLALLDHKSEQKDCQVDFNLPDVENMNACVKLVTSSSKGLAVYNTMLPGLITFLVWSPKRQSARLGRNSH